VVARRRCGGRSAGQSLAQSRRSAFHVGYLGQPAGV